MLGSNRSKLAAIKIEGGSFRAKILGDKVLDLGPLKVFLYKRISAPRFKLNNSLMGGEYRSFVYVT